MPHGELKDLGLSRWYPGHCHCKAVTFRVLLTLDVTITECNCSICSMSGHRELMVPESRLEILSGADALTTYQYGTRISRHTFCSFCGIKPFYRPRSHPEGYYSVNARCVDLRPAESIEVVQFDGQNWEESMAKGLHRVTD